jgi:hypothetical protein
MNLSQTLRLVSEKEKANGTLLNVALSLKRYRESADVDLLRGSDAFYLPAVNIKARIKWGRVFIEEIFEFFNITEDEHGPHEPIFLVTIADKSHLTTDQPRQINLGRIKRKLQCGLKGLSYVGMIEPGYYNTIYDQVGEKQKNVISWHGHCLVWGISKKRLARHLEGIKPRFTPIMPGLCAVHQKTIEPDQFGYKLWYLVKSPCTEYAIGKRRKPDKKTGAVRFKQNSRDIRPGNRVKLFHLMRGIYLDQLAMAGGQGRKLLTKIKYDALRDYRARNGWDDRRP